MTAQTERTQPNWATRNEQIVEDFRRYGGNGGRQFSGSAVLASPGVRFDAASA